MEFSKKLLFIDYLLLIILFAFAILIQTIDFSTIIVSWIAQIGISSAAYYWKAKNENRTKVPFKVIESLPPEMQDKIDLTTVITTIIQTE